MPKIDWTQIEGYREDMTADEKMTLFESYDPKPAPDPTPDPTSAPAPKNEPAPSPKSDLKGYIPKAQFDKLASELAAANKRIRAKMTEDEQREADRVAEQEAIKQELDNLRKEKTLSSYKASYLSQGYEEQLAEATAMAMVEGDMDAVFANMRKHSSNLEKALRAKILKETPVPPAGEDPNGDAQKNKEMAVLRESFGLPPKR